MRTKVLLADDDVDLLESLGELLRRAGYAVTLARSGDEALRLARNGPLDAVICDWALGPGPDGAAVMSEITHRQPDIVAIFITGSDLALLRGCTSGIVRAHYFQKPVSSAELISALRAAGCAP